MFHFCSHIEYKGMHVTCSSVFFKLFCNGPVVLVWDLFPVASRLIHWYKLILDQPLPQSSREAAHVLRHPALVRHAQCWSTGLLQVSWPRPPVVWCSSTFFRLSSCLDTHVGPMNLKMNSDCSCSFSFAVFYTDEMQLCLTHWTFVYQRR